MKKLLAGAVAGLLAVGLVSPASAATIKFKNNVTVSGTLGVTGAATFTTPLTTESIDQNLVKRAVVTLSSAQLLGMFAAPVTLIAAPGAGKTIVLEKAILTLSSGTAYASGGNISIKYASAADATAVLAAAVLTAGTATTTIRNGADGTASVNTALQLTNASGAFTTGTQTGTLTLLYSVQ